MQTQESTPGAYVANKGLPYKTMKDGNGMEVKIIDFENDDLMPRSGQIIFEATKKTARMLGAKTVGYTYSCGKDIQSECLVGIPVGIHHKSKEIVFQRLNLFPLNTYDLSIPAQRKQAIVLRYSYIVIGSPNLSANMACHMFREHDSEKAANIDIKRIKDGQRALMIADGLHGEDLFNMARNLGIMPETTTLTMLTAEVLKAAESRPQEFLAMYENPNRDSITILKRCLDTGVVSFDSLNGYVFGTLPLGHNEPQVYEYFRKYKDIAGTLDLKSRERLKESEKSMANAEPISYKTDADIENAVLKKQLEDMKRQMEEMSANSIREQVEAEKDAPQELVVKLEKLKAEASKFKMKGLHHFKPTEESIAKLQEKVDAAKSESIS